MYEYFPINRADYDGPVLITGAGGCIGSWAMALLTRASVPVVAFDLTQDKRRPSLLMSIDELASIPWLTGDVSDHDVVMKAVETSRASAIVHLAALQVPFCKADPVAGAKVNVVGTINMFEAARLASYLSRVRGPEYREWIGAAEAFTLATAGSARVLGFGDDMGAIAPGRFADLVFLDLAHINYVPLRDALLQLVNGESGTAIDAVMVGGRFVLQGGRLLTVDEAKMRRDAEAARERLDAANQGALQAARAMEDWIGAFCIAHARTPGLPPRHVAAD